jgi:hypothetical protein
LVLCCPQNGRSSPAPGAPILNLPCARGLTTPTAPTPALLSPDGAPARRLLMDGYVNDIRDDQDHPPGRKAAGRQWMASADRMSGTRLPWLRSRENLVTRVKG